jgi:CheY-like chemotaxis protein
MMQKTTRPGRVLVVDDNEAAAKVLGLLLSLRGYETREAYSAKQALEIAQSFAPDVAFLDIGIPLMDGFQIAEHFQRTPPLDNIYLIAITGFRGEANMARARAAGFQHYLVKPLDEETIVRVLADAGFAPNGHSEVGNGKRSR